MVRVARQRRTEEGGIQREVEELERSLSQLYPISEDTSGVGRRGYID
jgi:hypothetical protein